MLDQLIQNISNSTIQDFFRRRISSFRPEEDNLDYLLKDREQERFTHLRKLGEAEMEDTDELLVFSCRYQGELSSRSAKKMQYDIAKRVQKDDFKDGAIFIFYDEDGRFRFSFIRRNYDDSAQKYTPYKRYTYFVRPDKNNKTFRRRIEGCSFRSLDEIQAAFAVEPLSKQFYKDLSHWYFASLLEVKFPNEQHENEYNLHANAMIRLITRLMFVWFMKQKGLVPEELFDKGKLDDLIDYKDSNDSTYYKAILQNLFFATLNTPKKGKGREFIKEFQGKSPQHGIQNYYRYKDYFKNPNHFIQICNDIPFLNGGLFENLDVRDENHKLKYLVDGFSHNLKNRIKLRVPDYLFFGTCTADISQFFEDRNNRQVEITGLIDLLSQYDFTIDENTPYDQEVALDPELLGLVFENLLASYNPETESTARKESGSFYTPRPIVDYMVEESLVHYISNDTGVDIDLLRQVFTSSDDQPIQTPEDKKAIIKSISNLKIIDPACGSGAFPMGALQKMVHALTKLDPDNSLWKQSQKARLMQETFAAFESTELEDLKKEVDRIFDNELNDPDYARKLYLIENCLYGVDIQPIAMQISKLRFFISLLVEQHIDRQAENFGIIALPNLETKFVAANTLIKLKKPVSGLMGQANSMFIKNLKIEAKEKELEKVRHKYFTARTSKTKSKRRAEDKKLRVEIADILINDGWNVDEAQKIVDWDPFYPNNLSKWFDPEWMFGIRAFDIVIGNPPYKQVRKGVYSRDSFPYSEGLDKGKQNLYKLFVEASFNLAKRNGISCMIVQSSLLGDLSSSYTRKLLILNSCVIQILEFPKKAKNSSAQVFSSVLQGTCIYMIMKKNPETSHEFLISINNDVLSIVNPIFEKINQLRLLKIYPELYCIPLLKEGFSSILSKITDNSIPLNSFLLDISQGDLNLTSSKKYFSNNRSIVKLFRGRNVHRFYLNQNSDEYVQDGFKNEQVKYNSLNQFLVLQEITGTTDKYRLHCCLTQLNSNYLFGHTANKLLLKDPSMNISMMGVLNSSLMDWFFRITSTNNHVMGYELKQLPISSRMTVFKNEIDLIVENIINRVEKNLDTSTDQNKLDILIFKLYDLTYDEVLIVDPETAITREEFGNNNKT